MIKKTHICLISSIQLWVNPRLVKEADALVENGFQVTVITVNKNDWAAQFDQSLLQSKRWRAIFVDLAKKSLGGWIRWFFAALRSKIAFFLSQWFPGTHRLAEEAYYRGFNKALSAAIQCKADFYIAHTQGALPVAARAAGDQQVPFAFDCEDLLAEEAADGLRSPAIREMILGIEFRYLPRAAYVTVTSRSMAEYLLQQHKIQQPLIVHNVFPGSELNEVAPPDQRPPAGSLKLIWMSASIGQGRGIEDAIHALSLLPLNCELHLFGRVIRDYEQALQSILVKCGVSSRVQIHSIPRNCDVMKTISQFDVGLTLDMKDCLNRDLTVCNKLFLYLQGGLAIAATHTSGQSEILSDIPEAGFLYEPGDYRVLAQGLAHYAADSKVLLGAKNAAWKAGQKKYSWDNEKTVFLDAVCNALEK